MESEKTAMFDPVDFVSRAEKELATFCDNKINSASVIGEQYKILWEDIKEYILAGGKRIRPQITAAAYSGYGGKNMNEVLPVACAWELLHGALLIHDDIIDRDDVRHGLPNLIGMYKKRYTQLSADKIDHYALSSALLAGDLLLMGACEVINKSALSKDIASAVEAFILQAIYEVGGGEYEDVQSIVQPIQSINARSIIRYKTSGYSFSLPLQSGAMLAGADNDELTLLQNLGELIGLLFQLGDDVLGIFGDIAKTGKSNDSDIREKKRTLLLQKTLTKLSPTEVEKITQYFDMTHEITDVEISEVRELITKTHVKEEILDEIAKNAKQAHEIIAQLAVDKHIKLYLESLVRKLANRSY